MHKKRWITGLVSAPFLVGLISWGGVPAFALAIAALSILGLHECFNLLFPISTPVKILGNSFQGRLSLPLRMLAYVAGPTAVLGAFWGGPGLAMVVLMVNLMAAGLLTLKSFDGRTEALAATFRQVLAVVYVPGLLLHLVFLRNGESGSAWIYFILVVVFAGDIGAFYIGTFRGKHKLCLAVSPGKTVEGALGGLASNLVAGLLFQWIFLPELPSGLSAVFCVAAGIAAQLGDLFESMLKRAAGVKDSGILFPGHGGLLDRIDALLFAAPVAYLFKEFLLR